MHLPKTMSLLPLWLTIWIFAMGTRTHTITYLEMLIPDPRDAVHRVEQDSSSGITGIQRIKILAEGEDVPRRSEEFSVLPLNIESISTLNYDNLGSIGGDNTEVLRKRQATGSQTTVRQTSKTQNKPGTTEKTKNGQSDAKRNPPNIKEVKQERNPPLKNETAPHTQNKPTVKIASKSNEYSLGSTLILTVNEENEPSYVDQTQPHKLAEPLRFEPQVGSHQTQNNYATSNYEIPIEKQPFRTRPVVVESQPEIVPQNRPQKLANPIYDDPPPRKEISPVYDQHYYDRNKDTNPAGDSEEYPYLERHTEAPKPFRQEVYEQPSVNNRPEPYNSNPPPRKIEYEDPYSVDQKNSYREPSEGRYEVDRPVQNGQRRPVARPTYSEERNPSRPSYEESRPSYVDLKPSYEPEPVYQENRRPPPQPENTEYAGFPESHQPSRNPALSRPLQYDPPRVFPPSPCHLVFQYEGREPNNDSWNGDVYVSTDEVLVGMRLDITLDRPARLLSNWMSDVKTKDNVHFTILSLNKRLVPGPAESVRIQVRFNPDRPVPYVQSINLNGRRICPIKNNAPKTTTHLPYVNPGDLLNKPTTESYVAMNPPTYEERPSPPIRQPTRRTTTEVYPETRRTTTPRLTNPISRPDPNPNYFEESSGINRVPSNGPDTKPLVSNLQPVETVTCGKPSIQPRPLVTHGQMTARGQWPWHAAIYKNVRTDLSYICGGSLISARHVVTAAHCVTQTYDVKPLDASLLVVYLGKYHLKLWSEGGVQNKQVTSVKIHPEYNNTDFRADLAVLVLSSPVEFTEFIRPVCLWDRRKTDISEVESKEGTVIGWGFDEKKRLTEELMQAKMPVIKHDVCLWSYPEFFPQFTSNVTYCAGFRNGTSVCNGDSGGGMVFPIRTEGEERWYLRGLVSISVSEKENRVCDTKHYVVFTDIAKFLDWLYEFI